MSVSREPLLKIETFPVGTFACNCSIIYSPATKEALVIDPGNDVNEVMSRISALGLKVKALLHTHAHFDHIGQSQQVKNVTGAPVLLHRDDEFLYQALSQQGLFFGESVMQPPPCDGWISDDEEFGILLPADGTGLVSSKLRNILSAIHTPGHTPGSCSFYTTLLETPTLFSGDTLFYNSIGRTDLPGGDQGKLLASIKHRLLPLPDETVCIPGHGPATSIYHERKNNPYL